MVDGCSKDGMTGFWRWYHRGSGGCNTSCCQPKPKPEPKPKHWAQGVHVLKYSSDRNEVETVVLEGSDRANPTITGGGTTQSSEGWLNGLLKDHNANNTPQLTRADVIAVSFPEMTTGNIGTHAFTRCTSLTSVSFPEMTGNIGHYAFYNCASLTEVSFPNMAGDIESSAFVGCNALTSVSFPMMTGDIGDYAFRACTSLTSVRFPKMAGSIKNLAFFKCTALTSVCFPNMTTGDIGTRTFYECPRLGESDPGNKVIFAAPQNFTNFGTWTNVGTSGGRAAPQVVNNRLKFANGTSGILKPE